MLQPADETWTVHQAAELYEIARWGNGYFRIGKNGNLLVSPDRDSTRTIDLLELVQGLRGRDVATPLLVRFNQIIDDRLQTLRLAFGQAIEDHQYEGSYSCIYPIKVNQQRHVVEQYLRYGKPLGYGLEAGSKAELLAVVALADNRTPIVCNGFKDAEYIELVVRAAQLGRRILPVVEKFNELELILQAAARLKVRPALGIRIKLAARGSGRWQASAGYHSKFGLTSGEALEGLQRLQDLGMEDCLQLLHFHLGSQVTNIRHIKLALIEATRVFVDLVQRGAGLRILDVGGGLGVDYDGSQTNFESSANYTLQEYANDVVYHIQQVCQDAGVEQPDIYSESGRAVAAYHSVLVVNVLDVARQGGHASAGDDVGTVAAAPSDGSDKAPPAIETLRETRENLRIRNLVESFHDAQQALDMAISMFAVGHLTLEQRAEAERLFWEICRRIRVLSRQLPELPEELSGLDRLLADTYFCNFSLFQSIPDSWAIRQLFPVAPIHRHDERPEAHAVLGDITCDSDGQIDRFLDRRDVRRTLRLHALGAEPYYLGVFLVGAYQEILGDLHNLFGDTNAVHVQLDATGEVTIATEIAGDRVRDVLGYVQYDPEELLARLESSIADALAGGRLNSQEAEDFRHFVQRGCEGYTYLAEAHHRAPLPVR